MGSIPVWSSLFSIFHRANLENLTLLKYTFSHLVSYSTPCTKKLNVVYVKKFDGKKPPLIKKWRRKEECQAKLFTYCGTIIIRKR
jgi:hypothetical protein